MTFEKTFEDLLNDILTDYDGQGIDRAVGTLAFIKAACTASACWGIYKYQQWVSDQILPDTADDDFILGWARQFDITMNPGDTPLDILNALLLRFRNPPAGGNAADFIAWAGSVAGVKKPAFIFENMEAQGLGSIDLVIIPSDSGLEEIADSDLLATVYAYVNGIRPTGRGPLRVLPITKLAVDVTMTVTGSAVNKITLKTQIEAFMKALAPRQTLYRSQLIALAIEAGATNVVLTAPASDVAPSATTNQTIRPGDVVVT